jgi:uncharacterized protein YbjT (DUF2867 family)
MPPTIAVMAASGRTGKRIAHDLLDHGFQVRALSRSAAVLAELEAKGAALWLGEPADAGYLSAAFRGVDAAYGLLPYSVADAGYLARQRLQGLALARAAHESGLPRLVFLTSVGADLEGETGMIRSLHEQEQRLATLPGCSTLLLRAGAFFENYAGMLPLMREAGIVADALEPDRPLPMVGTRDIASAAATALRARDWTGPTIREVLGPRDLDSVEATRILGAALGLPHLQYVRLPDAEMEQALMQAGFAPDTAALTVELARCINSGRIRPVNGRHPGNTTPTGLEDYARELSA